MRYLLLSFYLTIFIVNLAPGSHDEAFDKRVRQITEMGYSKVKKHVIMCSFLNFGHFVNNKCTYIIFRKLQ